jgi:hypothetical protein
MIALAMRVPRAPVIGPSDAVVGTLSPEIARYLRAEALAQPIMRIVTRSTWPSGVGIALYLHKHGVSIAVDSEWQAMVGRRLIDASNDGSQLLVGDERAGDGAQGARLVASAGGVFAYFVPSPSTARAQ